MGRGSAEVQVEDRQGTVMRLGFVLAALLASQLALAQTGGSQSAFEAGKLLGQGKNQGAFSGITGGSAQDRIPRYGMSTPEASYFAGGKGETAGPGVGKMQSCASYTPGTDKVANQECEAVNLLARNPNVRPRFNIGQNDPMVQKYKQLRDNAEQAFAQFFPGSAGSQSQCVTRNETRPGQYSTGTCVSAQEVGTQQCTMGRVINIDTDANFQCEQTINAYGTQTCRRRVDVHVTSDVSGTSGRITLATIKPGAYLFTNGTSGGLWAHGINGVEMPVDSSADISGDTLGFTSSTDYPGTKRLLVSHNGCAGGWCSGSFNYQVWRSQQGNWWDLVAGSFSQKIQDASLCPRNFNLTETWYNATGSIAITASCPNASGAVTVSYNRYASYCGNSTSGTATLSAGQSVNVDITSRRRTCLAYISYYGSGSYNYNYWSKHDPSSDAHSWKAIGFSVPVQQDAITFTMTNDCALLESRSK